MKAFLNLVNGLSRACGVIAAVLLLLAVVFVCEMVFVRYVLNHSVYWQTEFVTYVLIASTLIGSPYVLRVGGHVRVDLVPLMLPPRGCFVLALVAYLVGFAFALLMAVYGYEYWHLALSEDWDSGTMWGISMWIPLLALPVGMGMLSLQYVASIVALLAGHERPFATEEQENPAQEDT